MLTDAGLLGVERSVITEDGKKYDLFRSTVKVALLSPLQIIHRGSCENNLIKSDPEISLKNLQNPGVSSLLFYYYFY